MKKGCIIGIIIAAIVVMFGFGTLMWGVKVNNRMVTMNETITKAWSSVETQYQRRNDLIPNFVNTVKGAARYEQETLTQVIEARAKATQVTVDPSNMTSEQLQQFQAAQGEVSSALARLMVVVEKYPELKATQNFRDLQIELEGTENRIAVARDEFNNVVKEYNTLVKTFPNSFIAGLRNFGERAYFKAAEGAEKVPVVDL